MLKFFKPRARHILLINSEGLSVYTLERNRLVHYAKFSDEDSGYENFRKLLEEDKPSAVTMLIDSGTEDFIVESLPRVNRMDRQAMLKRKLNQHFRGNEYRAARLISNGRGRSSEDRVLFSALTRNQFVDPWIRKLLQQHIPINSITTPAFALTHVARSMGMLTSDAVLLVNWETSGLRQSYVVDGKLMFSRLTPVSENDRGQLAQQIVEACRQSREYLERIGLLQFEKLLDIHVITPQLDDDAFLGMEDLKTLGRVTHHNSIDMIDLDKFGGSQDSITATIWCLNWGVRGGQFPNIYAPSAALQYFHLSQIRRAMILGVVLMLGTSGLISFLLMQDGLARSSHAEEVRASIVPVQNLYDSMRSLFPETPIEPQTMELAVRNYNLIRNNIRDPFASLLGVSQVLATQSDVALDNIYWNLAPVENNSDFNQALLDQQLVMSVELDGVLLGSTSAQDAVTRMEALITALEALDGVAVLPLLVPIESDPFSAVDTTINDEIVDEPFSLLLSFEA